MLRFVDRREIEAGATLTEVERAQLHLIGDRLPAVLWRVVAGDRQLFDAWIARSWDGAIFRGQSIDRVATIAQGVLECADRALGVELGVALVEARLLSRQDPAYGDYAELLAKRQAGVVLAPILAEGTMPETPHALAEAFGLERVSAAELAAIVDEPLRAKKKKPKKKAKPKPKPKAKAKPKKRRTRR